MTFVDFSIDFSSDVNRGISIRLIFGNVDECEGNITKKRNKQKTRGKTAETSALKSNEL